jgi:hypothetical protein
MSAPRSGVPGQEIPAPSRRREDDAQGPLCSVRIIDVEKLADLLQIGSAVGREKNHPIRCDCGRGNS